MKTLLIALLLCASATVCLAQSTTLTTDGIVFQRTTESYASYLELIESCTLKDGKMEIIKRSTAIPSRVPALGCLPSPCDWTIRRVWKEIYAAKDGRLILENTIEGKIVPASKESYEWPK